MMSYDEACRTILEVCHLWEETHTQPIPQNEGDSSPDLFTLMCEEPYSCVECQKELVIALGVHCARCKATDPDVCWGAMHAAFIHVLRTHRNLLDEDDEASDDDAC